MGVTTAIQSDLNEFAEFAQHLADLSRSIAHHEFQNIPAFQNKGDGSPVTAADEAVEAELLRAIRETYPDHGILGEETGCTNLDRDLVWVVDPIDGTKSFATGTSTFGSLIALCHRQKPVIGVIELPVSGWRYVGVAGEVTSFNGVPVSSRKDMRLSDCVLSASGGEFFRGPAPRSGFERLREQCDWTVYGAGCSAFGSLSRGLMDICLEGANLATFDFCALVPVVEGAGGKITDWRGRPFRLVPDMTHRADGVVATGDAALHEKVLQFLNP
ncbi:histidinol phosphate phosphatase [Ruegeria sp. 2012CJ41-6]|uniref:Histidinol phosphate phosphatase n=1 Tax=Ruegeria spongiae TaxID=2942209 RepID=A0ABT0Q730_9RHOB|nr:inositol monophosphatase family protein [Ruegeria spongiae]MCL6285685.1 histidinol phosphate phosphatase [Ruegeria spongiae]